MKEGHKTIIALICEGCCDFPPFFLFTLLRSMCVPRPSAIGFCST